MKLSMSSLKFDADVNLLDFIQKKADKLDQFYDRIIDGEVNLRLEKNDEKGNKLVEFKLNIPGSTLFASEQSKTFEEATDMAVEAMRKQLEKVKGRAAAK